MEKQISRPKAQSIGLLDNYEWTANIIYHNK